MSKRRNSNHFSKQQGGSSMITKKRILMAVQNEIQLNHARKFEGLQVIDKVELTLIKKVWANNKTPVILNATDEDVGRYKRISLILSILQKLMSFVKQMMHFVINVVSLDLNLASI